ncbi:MAG: hypothetical protein QOD99_170, partial [Chthoniobacter sp.]|nr:hypothetical protein [Chthoniobacter sp.]
MRLAKKLALFKNFRALLAAEDRFYAKLLGSSLVGVCAIAMLAAFFFVVAVRDHNYGKQRTRTLEILRETNKIENDLATLETGHRGFLLTGNAAYVEPFNRHKAGVQTRLAELSALFAVEPKQLGRIEEVRKDVDAWLNEVALPALAKRSTQPNSPEMTASITPG